jgi:hypothetical protein
VPTLFAANESAVMIDGERIEGVRAVEYRKQQARENVYALGSGERIGMVSGAQVVEGLIRVASTNAALDGKLGEAQFQITAQLQHGETAMTVTFDECYLMDKEFSLGVGGVGEATYRFTATRVREEMA